MQFLLVGLAVVAVGRFNMKRNCALVATALALQIGLAFSNPKIKNPMEAVTIPAGDPLLNKANLDQIKRHIIALGARCTYLNMYNHNPCWSLAPYVFYLNPDPGPDGHPQWNVNCDVTRGDFNTLVIEESESGRQTSVDFRPKEAVVLRSYRGTFKDSPGEFKEAQVAFRRAVTAALQAINGG